MLKRWQQLSSRTVLKNPWWTYMLDEFRIPGGTTGEYNYVHTNGSSMVVPVLPDGRIVLVNQYRYLCDRESIELPCGGVKDGKSREEMAQIELTEETGYRATEIQAAGTFNPFNGVTDEMCSVFIATGLETAHAVPDDTEEFELLLKTPEEIDALIRSNMIWDGMTIAAWALVRHQLP